LGLREDSMKEKVMSSGNGRKTIIVQLGECKNRSNALCPAFCLPKGSKWGTSPIHGIWAVRIVYNLKS